MWVYQCATAPLGTQTLPMSAGPVRPGRGWFWRRSIISNGSGSHNGGTLSDQLGMHCGRQKGSFDLCTYVHRSVPCLKSDPLSDIALPYQLNYISFLSKEIKNIPYTILVYDQEQNFSKVCAGIVLTKAFRDRTFGLYVGVHACMQVCIRVPQIGPGQPSVCSFCILLGPRWVCSL